MAKSDPKPEAPEPAKPEAPEPEASAADEAPPELPLAVVGEVIVEVIADLVRCPGAGDGRCVGRPVNGLVCSYHAVYYRPDGTPR